MSLKLFPARRTRALLATAALLLLPAAARAIPAYSGGIYQENFDSLPSAPSASASSDPNFRYPWLDDFTLPGWFYTTTIPVSESTGGYQRFRAGHGDSTTGSLYSFGTDNAPDRALGLHTSNVFTQVGADLGEGDIGIWLALRLRNATSQTYTSFTLTYDGEQWHKENTDSQRIDFAYKVDPNGLMDPDFADINTLDYASPTFPTATSAALDGNNPANRHPDITSTINNIHWDPGTDLWLRWTNINDIGRDHGLAIDNLRFSAAGAVPGPSTWIADADGNWSDAANWLNGIPNAPGATARFGSAITVARTVTLDTPRTVGALYFHNEHQYTLAGPGTLTINGGAGSSGLINVSLGAHEIAAPLNFVAPAEIALSQNTSLKLSGPVTGKLTKLSLADTATLDLTTRSLVLRAPSPDARFALFTSISDLIRSARNDGVLGRWTGPGLTSSSAASDPRSITSLGVAINDRGDGTPLTTLFHGTPVDTNDVLTAYTYDGDADLNGIVNADDYARIDHTFFILVGPLEIPLPPLIWPNGDFNYDGDVNIDDYFLIDRAFANQSSPIAAASAHVPEPAGSAYVVFLLGPLLLRRRGERPSPNPAPRNS